ncbi:hypothetical protein FACS1894125_3790 [Actinomycetota bacterium]|nr:hypothetical protein FACS1894125_3790 [Actinomycetota bacterium]
MIKLIFGRITHLFAQVFGNIRRQSVRTTLVLLALFVVLTLPMSLIFSLLNMSDSLSTIGSQNYTNAISKLETSKNILGLEEWKVSFNQGVSYFQLDQQEDARSSFDNARTILETSNDIYDLCTIDINYVYSVERSAQILSEKQKDASSIRNAAQLYLQAFIKRTEISSKCDIIGRDGVKNNQDAMENDKNLYSELISAAHDIDGITVDNEISSKIDQNVNDLSKIEEDTTVDSERVKELYTVNQNAQEDFQKGQDLVNKNNDNSKVLKPW